MATSIIVTDRKFYNTFENGTAFADNLGDYNLNLVGYADERIRTEIEVSVETEYIADDGNPITLVENPPASTFHELTINNSNWLVEGFTAGDTVQIDIILFGLPPTFFTAEGTITAISRSLMIVQVTSGSLTPIGAGTSDYRVTVHNLTPLTALKYSFGLNSNDEEYNNTSKTTGADQTFNASGIGLGSPVRSTTPVFMNPDGTDINNDWHSGVLPTVNFVSETSDGFVQSFRIVHEFIINPSYVEGQLNNLLTKVAPDLYFGDASLKYTSKFDFRSLLSNPNSSKIDIDQNNKGSVGWREESLNGFKNNFRVESVIYTDNGTGLPADGVLRSGVTKAVITVKKLTGNWVNGDRIGVIIKKLPTEDEYTNTLTNYSENFLLNDIYHNVGDAITSNPVPSILASLDSQVGAAADLQEYIVLINYTSGQQTQIDEGTNYELTALAGSVAATNQDSDRVALIADVLEYDLTNDIPDLVVPVSQLFYEEPLPVSTGLGYTSIAGWNYDNIAAVNVFDIDLSKGAFINSINMLWIAFDPVTNEYWEVQNYAIQYEETLVSGVQQLTLDSTRGFHLEDNSDFNDVIVTTGALVGSLQRYTVQVPFNVDWRDWQPDLNADTIFYDNAELNNNLNKRSNNYSNLNGYELRFGLFFDMSGNSPLTGEVGQTDYLMLSPNNEILNEDLPIDYTATIETFTEDGLTNLNGAIKDSGNTLFKATFNQVSGPFTDLANHWATHKIEDVGQLGDDVDKLSTENFHPTNNKLNPVAGESLLKKELISGDIVTTCLIDGALVNTGQNLIVRLGTKDNVPPVLPDGKLTTDDTPKETTGSDLKEQAP